MKLAVSALLLTAVFLAAHSAKATPAAFSCDFNGENLVFTTDMSKDAVSIRRVYAVDDMTYYIHIRNLNEMDIKAEIVTDQNGKQTNNQAVCTYVLGD
jgi:hypothetical protein